MARTAGNTPPTVIAPARSGYSLAFRAFLLVACVVLLGAATTSPTAASPGPSVDGFGPVYGSAGTPVRIIGSGFTGTTGVAFDGTPAGFTEESDSRISTAVPAGARTGAITVTTLLGTATSDEAFGVVPASPNIVLILTDDQRFDELGHMPTVRSELVGKGVLFSNGFVVNPVCCPSRTTILTGEYSHSTNIYRNVPPHGGFATFTPEDDSTIATVLRGQGYRTALIGKYLNGYTPAHASYVPPGWDRWVAAMTRAGGAYGYRLSVDGRVVSYGSKERDYSTDVLARYAARFIDSVPSERPLFLYFAPHPPHGPATPPERYRHACQDLRPLRPPSYNEADVSDKPQYVRKRPLRTGGYLDALRKRGCQSLLSVDDALGTILGELQATNRLSNTLIVYASDNGLMLGEHRLFGKQVPYEESIRIPIVVRFDPLTRQQRRVNPDLVLNLDFGPTFADAAGTTQPGAEGVSFLRLLSDPEARWRTDFLIEHWKNPTYCGVHRANRVYVEYSTGEEELYNLVADPYQLKNRASDPAYRSTKQAMHDRLLQLCSPPPPDFAP